MNKSGTLRLLGFGAAVVGLVFSELVAPILTDKVDEEKINELVDARVSELLNKEDE